jgi:cytochrome c biogenesis protein CcmG/thiol:disulfide interchange protein DsbE
VEFSSALLTGAFPSRGRNAELVLLNSYYRKVNQRASHWPAAVILLVSLLGSAGCNRGSLPRNIGTLAPEFTLHDPDSGQTIDLRQYRGRVVLLNFWATWCPPCLEEMPSLQDLHRRMPQLVILAVSVDTDAATYQQFLRDNHVDFVDLRDPAQTINHLYGTAQFPETYVIDPSGRLRRKFIGAQDWTSPEILRSLAALTAQK